MPHTSLYASVRGCKSGTNGRRQGCRAWCRSPACADHSILRPPFEGRHSKRPTNAYVVGAEVDPAIDGAVDVGATVGASIMGVVVGGNGNEGPNDGCAVLDVKALRASGHRQQYYSLMRGGQVGSEGDE